MLTLATPPAIVTPSPAHVTPAVVVVSQCSDETVDVGDIVVIPIFDGDVAGPPAGSFKLEDLGRVRIAPRDLFAGCAMTPAELQSYKTAGMDARSDRAEAFRVVGRGHGVIHVIVRLPHFKDACASCRDVRYTFGTQPPQPSFTTPAR
jgi:hypothetical protein